MGDGASQEQSKIKPGPSVVNAIPLVLTLSRFAMAPVMVVSALLNAPPIVFGVCLTAAVLTDIFDGIIARRLKIATETLRRLDSTADSVFYGGTLIAIWILHKDMILDHRVGLLVLLCLEVIRYIFDYLKFGKEASYHAWSAKIWGLSLYAACMSVLVYSHDGKIAESAILIGCYADVEGLLISVILPTWQSDVASLYHAVKFLKKRGGSK
jgi:phosphatidylglycerophosphate synthase